MKILKAVSLLLIFVIVSNTTNAQLKDWFNKKKLEAKEKVNSKLDQKSSEGIDKVIDAPETAIKKKKSKKGATTVEENSQATTTDNVTESNENLPLPKETIITTNILCDKGKKNIEALLRDTDGINSVSIDASNGKVYLSVSKPELASAVEDIIRQNGFEANGKKPTQKVTKPCS